MAHQGTPLTTHHEEHEALSTREPFLDDSEGSRSSRDDDDFEPDLGLEQVLDAAEDAETLRKSHLESYHSDDDDDCSSPVTLFHAGYSMASFPVRTQAYTYPTHAQDAYITRDTFPDRIPVRSYSYSTRVPAVHQGTMERQLSFKRKLTEPEADPNLVTWEENDPDFPHSMYTSLLIEDQYEATLTDIVDWPAHRRWISTIIIAMYAFIAPMASTMVAPALDTISDEFDLKTSVEEFLVMSIFLLAFAIGPFLWGRQPLLCCSRCVR